MRHFAVLVAVCACWAASGCAPGMTRSLGLAKSPTTTSPSAASSRRVRQALDLTQVAVQRNSEFAEPAKVEDAAPSSEAASNRSTADLAEYAEEVARPQPKAMDLVTTPDDISDPDALTRRVVDVPMSIRPPQGEMPTDLAAAVFAHDAQADEEQANRTRQETIVSWTPWTLCYRPLYFEEIELERYGCSAGCFQPSISAAHFFLGVGLMPYKVATRLPRSCVCSNGFSSCDDVPPPGYEDCQIHWDAAAIEAATLAAIVLSLP